MGGKYNMHVDGCILAIDDDGGCDITEYAKSRGEFAAICLFMEWLEFRKRELEILDRQRSIKIVSKGGGDE